MNEGPPRFPAHPTREAAPQDDGTVIVYVTPPAMLELPRVSVHMAADQYDRYVQWRLGRGLIQDHLSDLSANDREKLMTGLADTDFLAG